MYRRPKFLEILLEIRQEMAREADYDTDLFAEMIRTGAGPTVSNDEVKLPKKKNVNSKEKRSPRKK
jgi:hypothetical protein